MKTLLEIRIELGAIDVDNEGYYSFTYNWYKNGGEKRHRLYSSDYEGQTRGEWLKKLRNGEALRIAIQEIAEEI